MLGKSQVFTNMQTIIDIIECASMKRRLTVCIWNNCSEVIVMDMDELGFFIFMDELERKDKDQEDENDGEDF